MTRQSIFPILLFTLLFAEVRSGIWSVGCGVVSETGLYDLKDMASQAWSVDLPNMDETLQFGICGTIPACNANDLPTYFNLLTSNSTCIKQLTSTVTPSYSLSTVNATGKTAVAINYTSSSYACDATGLPYQFVVYVACNEKIPRSLAVPKILVSDVCNYEIYVEVDKGCPMVDLNTFWAFVQKYLALFAIGFILMGIAVGAFGQKMWSQIIFTMFAVTITVFFLVIFYQYVLPFNSPEWCLWFILILSVSLGIGFSFLITRYQAAGFVILGVWLGASFTIVFENILIRVLVAGFLVFRAWKTDRIKTIFLAIGLVCIPAVYTFYANVYTFWSCVILTSALCGAAAYFLKELLTTMATSFVGAYLAIRGLSFAVGNFPSEYEIYKQIRSGNLQYSNVLTIYAFVILLLSGVFFYVQTSCLAEKNEDEEHSSYDMELNDN